MKTKKKKKLKHPQIKLEVIEHKDWTEWCRLVEDNRRRQQQGKLNEDDPLVEAVFEFIEEEKLVNERRPIPVEGERKVPGGIPYFKDGELYQGLGDFLREKCFNKKQRRRVNIGILNAAWRMYSKYYPSQPRPELAVALEPNPVDSGVGNVKKKCRAQLWGINVSDLIRALGKDGLDFEEVKHILTHFNIEVKDSTIRGQIWCGKQLGRYGKIPKLLDWQQKKIEEALSS